MYQLDAADYGVVRPVFQALDHHLAVSAILEGSVPASIFVDHPLRPRAAFTWTKHRLYLSGSADNDGFNRALGRLVAERIRPQRLEAGAEVLVLYYAPEVWESQVDVILGSASVRVERQFYQFRAMRNAWPALLSDGFVLQFIDKALLEREHLVNLEGLMDEMSSERQSTDDFLARSFGVCLLHGDEIVGWCLSEYNSADRCEVGIEVLELYRRRGLATVMASALIEHALSAGVSRIGWHCYAGNIASSATARRVGLEQVQDYAVYVLRLDGSLDPDHTKSAGAGQADCPRAGAALLPCRNRMSLVAPGRLA